MSGSGVFVLPNECEGGVGRVGTGATPEEEADVPARATRYFVLLRHPRSARVVIVSSLSMLWYEVSQGNPAIEDTDDPVANSHEGVYGITVSRKHAEELWRSISAYHDWKYGGRWVGFENGPPPRRQGGRLGSRDDRQKIGVDNFCPAGLDTADDD